MPGWGLIWTGQIWTDQTSSGGGVDSQTPGRTERGQQREQPLSVWPTYVSPVGHVDMGRLWSSAWDILPVICSRGLTACHQETPALGSCEVGDGGGRWALDAGAPPLRKLRSEEEGVPGALWINPALAECQRPLQQTCWEKPHLGRIWGPVRRPQPWEEGREGEKTEPPVHTLTQGGFLRPQVNLS